MFDIDRWREIFQSISKNKLRTFLGAFTVSLGIFIFTVLFGMGNGLKNQFKECWRLVQKQAFKKDTLVF